MKLTVIGILLLALAVNWALSSVSVSNALAPTPTAVPPNTPAVQDRVRLLELPGIGHRPTGVAIIGDQIYVLNAQTFNIAVVSSHPDDNNRVVKFIPLGERPVGGLASPPLLAADAANKRAYVANVRSDSIALIENERVARTRRIGAEASALLFLDNHLFVGLDYYNLILVLDPATLEIQARIPLPADARAHRLVGDAARHRVYTSFGVIDATRLLMDKTHPLTDADLRSPVAFVPDDRILISQPDRSTNASWLVALDVATGAEQGRVKISSEPAAAVVNADGSRVYLAQAYDNQVVVIDPRTMTTVATILVDVQPRALALDESAHLLYVANAESDNLNVINSDENRVTARVPFALLPTALVANPDAGRVYVANASTDSVFVLEGNRVAKEIRAGRYPSDIARDANANRVLVANKADGTLAVIGEADFSIRAANVITSSAGTIAVDAAHARAFFGNTILDLQEYAPKGQLEILGGGVQTSRISKISAERLRINPGNNRIYAVGWNGAYGSGSGQVVYTIDGDTLKQRGVLTGSLFNMRFQDSGVTLDFDPATNRVFVMYTGGRFDNRLGVYDANDKQEEIVILPARAAGMVFNPQTHHLFLAHPDNTVQILDTRSFGTVAQLNVNAPGAMTRLGDSIFVAGLDGQVTLIQDTESPIPAPATPTPEANYTPQPPRKPVPAVRLVPKPAPVLRPGWTSFTNANLGIRALGFDSNGNLWSGSEDGAVHWNFKDGSYIKFAVENGLADNRITCIAIARDGSVWFGTAEDGAARFVGSKGEPGKSWKRYTKADGLASNAVHAIAAAPDGTVWFATNSGVTRFDGRAFKTFTQADGMADDLVWALGIAGDGAVWVGTGGGGVSRFDYDASNRNKAWTNYNTIDGLANNVVIALAPAPDGSVWFGTNGGVSRWNGRTFEMYTEADGLASNYITSIAVAPDGTVWAGSNLKNGLSRFDGREWKTFTRADGLADDAILSLTASADNAIWIGTRYGITRFVGSKGEPGEKWTTYLTADGLGGDPPIGNSVAVSDVAMSLDGALWFATNNGVSRYVGSPTAQGKTWTTFSQSDGLPDTLVSKLALAKDGAIWAGTLRGVARFDGSKWKTYNQDNGLPDNDVADIAAAPDGKIWVGTFNGLAAFDGASWKTFTQADGLAGDFANHVAVSPNGHVWVKTSEGVSRFDGASWKTFTAADGLPDAMIWSIAAAPDNAIWFATAQGVARYDGKSWKTFTSADGLADNSISAIAVAPDGTVWAWSDMGVSYYDGRMWKTINSAGLLDRVSSMTITPDGAVWFTSGSSVMRFDAKMAR